MRKKAASPAPGRGLEKKPLTRRDFIKTAGLFLSGLSLRPWDAAPALPEFPAGERLGRVIGGKVPLKAAPTDESQEVGTLFEDSVVTWLREVVGSRPMWHSQRYVETPEGYIYAPNLQPVRNQPNLPLKDLGGAGGRWFEVTVPYIDLALANPPARSPWLETVSTPRLYYSQVMWVDQVRTDDQGQVWYRTGEKYGTFGDFFWVPAEALRPIGAEEIEPLSPGVEEKKVVVHLLSQTLSAFEGQNEVYFCRVSTGDKFDKDGNPSDKWSTPVGEHTIWRKLVSVHMTGGTAGGGYDLPGIGWTVLFSGNGVALHSTFWHNNFGVRMSHGCVNLMPDDAKWLFRWTSPPVSYDPGDLYSKDTEIPPTKVKVIEA
jgi:hypothetical protein